MPRACHCPIGTDRWYWCDCPCERCVARCPRLAETCGEPSTVTGYAPCDMAKDHPADVHSHPEEC